MCEYLKGTNRRVIKMSRVKNVATASPKGEFTYISSVTIHCRQCQWKKI